MDHTTNSYFTRSRLCGHHPADPFWGAAQLGTVETGCLLYLLRIITDYADAAKRMQAGGTDGIELDAYGHLLDHFWSPLANVMSGPYGSQSLTSRTQFAFDVLQAIRDRVGPDFIVGVRFTADAATPGRLRAQDGFKVATRLEMAGPVDF